MTWLNWPAEQATRPALELPRYRQNESLCLELHGDPVHARLVVVSDGNHHMALQEALHAFSLTHPEVGGIFLYDDSTAYRDADVARGRSGNWQPSPPHYASRHY